MQSKLTLVLAAGLSALWLAAPAGAQTPPKPKKPDLPPFADVSEGYEKVVSTADGAKSLYTLWVDRKKNQVLGELPRGYESQRHFIAMTQASGGIFAGLQGPVRYVYWKRYNNRLALIQPEVGTRSTGEAESKSSVARLFTDRVLLDVPIVANGPSGQPVIDMDDLFAKQAAKFAGGRRGGGAPGANSRLIKVVKAKAFPKNIELAFELPVGDGQLVTMHYSISLIPDKTPGYKPRVADERVGYFTTVYRDLGKYQQDEKWVRYIDRWHLEKRDPSLSLSPPKEPIVFHLEHTIPVRYRRWVRQGVEYWNEAFRAVGLDNAIEVRIQDKVTGRHMEKDPEDVRYNFIRWLNNDISTAIGPHRAHPLTGQILDADIVLTDGWIRAYWGWYHEQMPQLAIQSFSPETLEWLEAYPDWDPRVLLASSEHRSRILAKREARRAAGVIAPERPNDPVLAEDEDLAAISEWLGDEDHLCLAAHGLAFDMATAQLHFDTLMGPTPPDAPDAPEDEADMLDGIPEWFIGPLLAELTCHEVGHTLGLRHNFKASSIHTLAEINSEAWKGKKTVAGSVMDYLPANFNMDSGEAQGDYTMIAVGPYDMWAIEYGYTFGGTDKVLERVAEPELAYLTDDDTGGPDPLARRYDYSADPLDYAQNQMRLADHHRERILSDFVTDGESWSKARRGYSITLGIQSRALSMMSNWVGGAHVNRDRKGDPGNRAPIEVVDPAKQRAALDFVIENALFDEAYGLTPELLVHMTVDKWSDQSRGDRSDSTWPVHQSVMAMQATALTMLMNPTTLGRVYDNEFRTPADEDALTLPEMMDSVISAVFAELDVDPKGAYSDRTPMISSLRRNLQSVLVGRLITLSEGMSRMPPPVRTLATQHLRDLDARIGAVLEKAGDDGVDRYTRAHLTDLEDRIDKALNAVHVR